MAKFRYERKIALPTVLLILFIAAIAYFLDAHWDVSPALHSAGKFALAMLAIIAAFIIFDVVLAGITWVLGAIGGALKKLFK